jgi:hypothetical protein
VIPREDDGTGGVFRPPLPTRGEERNAGEKQLLSVWERQETSQTIPHMEGEPLFNVDKASFDMQGKLVEYALNPEQPKHVLFERVLGATQKDAKMIYDQVMAFLPHAEAIPHTRSPWGNVFDVMMPVTGPNGKTVDVVTGWIYDFVKGKKAIRATPRLATIFIFSHTAGSLSERIKTTPEGYLLCLDVA